MYVLSGMNLVEAYRTTQCALNQETVLKTVQNYLFPNGFQLDKVNFGTSSYWMPCKQIAGMKTNNWSSAVCLPS